MESIRGKLLFPFIAPPNGGKGTQTAILSKKYNLPRIDMGALLREIAKEDSELGRTVKSRQESGRLVDSVTVIQVLRDGLQKLLRKYPETEGFILDGFPRSAEQVDGLMTLCEEDGAVMGKAFYLKVPDDVILKRAVNRRLCPTCNEIYNLLSKQPKVEGKCDLDGSELVHRADDYPEKVQERLRSFEEDTRPIIARFRKMGNLVKLDGNRPAEAVTEEIIQHMSALLQPSLSNAV